MRCSRIRFATESILVTKAAPQSMPKAWSAMLRPPPVQVAGEKRHSEDQNCIANTRRKWEVELQTPIYYTGATGLSSPIWIWLKKFFHPGKDRGDLQ